MNPLKRLARWLLRREIDALNDDIGLLVAAVLTDKRWKGMAWRYDPSRQECRVVSDPDSSAGGSFCGIDHLYAINVCRLMVTGDIAPTDDLADIMPKTVADRRGY